MQHGSHRRDEERRGKKGIREGGRDWYLGTRMTEEKEREKRKRQEVGKAHLLKGSTVNVDRRCS